jgi:hypothetical protein
VSEIGTGQGWKGTGAHRERTGLVRYFSKEFPLDIVDKHSQAAVVPPPAVWRLCRGWPRAGLRPPGGPPGTAGCRAGQAEKAQEIATKQQSGNSERTMNAQRANSRRTDDEQLKNSVRTMNEQPMFVILSCYFRR